MSDDADLISPSGQDVPGDVLFVDAYRELAKIARAELSRHRRGQTLNTNALVHETYLKLFAQRVPTFAQRKHFFATAALVMRQIVIDHARSRDTQRRGGAMVESTGDYSRAADVAVADQAAELVAIANCLDKLAGVDARAKEVMELRFFAGLELNDIAALLEVSEKTVQRDCRFAQAFVQRELGLI